MRDREEQQQKAQLHRVPSARRSCDERSSAHNYRDRYGRVLPSDRFDQYFPVPWLVHRFDYLHETTFAKLAVPRKKKRKRKENPFVFFEISRYREISPSTYLLLRVSSSDFSVSSFLHVSTAGNVIEIIAYLKTFTVITLITLLFRLIIIVDASHAFYFQNGITV